MEDEKTAEPASGNSDQAQGVKRRPIDKKRKRGFYHGTQSDAEYMTALGLVL